MKSVCERVRKTTVIFLDASLPQKIGSMLLSSNFLKKYFKNFSITSVTRRHKMDTAFMVNLVMQCIPPLDGKSHKGQAGRIGIVGGSLEYTGAPYFAGISALKVGADLVHIFCTSPASSVIKSYSPELIVHPLLDQPNAVTQISPWLDRLHAIVIGPGLGRDDTTFDTVSDLIKTIETKKIPLVIDADGLFLITNKPELIRDFESPVILTPNKIEFERLCDKFGGTSALKGLGSHVTVLKKGEIDEVFSPEPVVQWKSHTGGSGRRCGGQGDLLSGAIATFLHWTLAGSNKMTHSRNQIYNVSAELVITDLHLSDNLYRDKAESTIADKTLVASSLSCYAASSLIRRCNEKAFKIHGRSMLASDMIHHIHDGFEELFGQ